MAGIFEAGLRPLRVRGLEHQLCEIRPAVEVRFRVHGIDTPPLLAEWEFDFNGKKLVAVKGISATPWTVGDAFENVQGLEKAMGGDSAAMKAWLSGYPETSTNGDMWGRSIKKNGVKAAYYFRHSFQDVRPFLFTFRVEWDFTQAEIDHGREPLQPPPGFEDFDMRPMSARGMDNPVGGTVAGPNGSSKATSGNEQKPTAGFRGASTSDTDRELWPWLAAFAMLLISGAIWASARRTHN